MGVISVGYCETEFTSMSLCEGLRTRNRSRQHAPKLCCRLLKPARGSVFQYQQGKDGIISASYGHGTDPQPSALVQLPVVVDEMKVWRFGGFILPPVPNRVAPVENMKHVVVRDDPTPGVGCRAQVVFRPPVFARYPPAAEPPPRRKEVQRRFLPRKQNEGMVG